MATVPQILPEQRVLLHNISWQSYENLLKEFGDSPVRLTYDDGELEIMSPSHGHERYAWLIGRLIAVFTEELGIPIHGGKSTTFKRKKTQKGLEPDECYWIQNEPRMRGRNEFDPESDPPPDLVLEIDITSSSLDRMAIYAALGVPEVWRFDGESLEVYSLRARRGYRRQKHSPSLPSLPPTEVVRFLRASESTDETSWIRSFRAWVREQVLARRAGTGRTKPSAQRSRPSRRKGRRGKRGDAASDGKG